MNARDAILSAIRARRARSGPRASERACRLAPDQSHLDADATDRGPRSSCVSQMDAVAEFAQRAQAAGADVRRVMRMADVPRAIAAVLRDRNDPAIVHVPPDAVLQALPWSEAAGLTLEAAPPGPDDAALARARYAVSETGTLAYPSHCERPASWHFRAGLEIAVLRADAILPNLESVIAQVKRDGALPHTINFVTGPSRTGDIEQTLELGAHGPKALVVLIVDGE